jgi:hypothetical protein
MEDSQEEKMGELLGGPREEGSLEFQELLQWAQFPDHGRRQHQGARMAEGL